MSAMEDPPPADTHTSLPGTVREDAGHLTDVLEKRNNICEVNEAGVKSEPKEADSIYDLEDGAFHMGTEVMVDPAAVQKLSEGFLQHFLPSLEKSKSSISEILSNQTVLIDTLEQENAKFSDCTAHTDLANIEFMTVFREILRSANIKQKDAEDQFEKENMHYCEMLKARNYHNKLLNIKREMANLHDKATKLKRRALKLQQQKQKEELQRAHQQERELEKEQMLTARVAQPDT